MEMKQLLGRIIKKMNKIEADLYELKLLKILRETEYDKLEILKRTVDYVLHDRFLKECRLRGDTKQ